MTTHYKSTTIRPDMLAPGTIDRIPAELAWAPTKANGEQDSFTPTEDLAVQIARSVKHGKSGGPDDQVAEILCVVADTPNGCAIIHGLFLSWWNDGDPTCPVFWLHARLAIVPKPNHPSLNLNNTRGITVGTLEIKLVGAFNTYWLERWLHTHDFENQSGVRSKRGRADPLRKKANYVAPKRIQHRHAASYASSTRSRPFRAPLPTLSSQHCAN